MLPGVTWRPLNLIFTTIVFIWISYWVANATGVLTKMIIGGTDAKPNIDLPAPVTATRNDHDAERDMDQRSGEENIPLVSNMDGSSTQDSAVNNHPPMTEKALNYGEQASRAMPAQDGAIMASVSGGVDEPLEAHEQASSAPAPISAPTSVPGKSWIELSSSLPVRLSLILFAMWFLNVLWPSSSPSTVATITGM